MIRANAGLDGVIVNELDPHFALLRRQGVATFWSDHEIYAGSDWAAQIDENLRGANIILLLLSANFIDSNYCFDVELRQAVERHLRREAVVIPVVPELRGR